MLPVSRFYIPFGFVLASAVTGVSNGGESKKLELVCSRLGGASISSSQAVSNLFISELGGMSPTPRDLYIVDINKKTAKNGGDYNALEYDAVIVGEFINLTSVPKKSNDSGDRVWVYIDRFTGAYSKKISTVDASGNYSSLSTRYVGVCGDASSARF